MDGGARQRVERLLRRVRQMGGPPPGFHCLLQLCNRLDLLAASQDGPNDRRTVSADHDRHLLVHGGRQALGGHSLAFSVDARCALQAGFRAGSSEPRGSDGQPGGDGADCRRNARGDGRTGPARDGLAVAEDPTSRAGAVVVGCCDDARAGVCLSSIHDDPDRRARGSRICQTLNLGPAALGARASAVVPSLFPGQGPRRSGF